MKSHKIYWECDDDDDNDDDDDEKEKEDSDWNEDAIG